MANTKYMEMKANGATEDELRQLLQGQGVAQSYTDRENAKAAAAAASQPTYQLPSQWFNGMSRIGADQGWKIDNSEAATWQKIAQMANSGDTQGAINLANQLRAAGKFGGYYDDAGNYWGFAQGYTGGANASMQPVIGGKMLTPNGLEYENTGIWLTPDNKALSLGANGTLTNNGETWGTTDTNPYGLTGRWFNENQPIYGDIRDTTWTAWAQQQGWDPAETQQHMAESGAFTNPALNTPQGNQQRLTELQANPNADPAAIAETQRTIYQQALGQAGNTGGSYNGTAAGNYTPTQPLSYEQWSAQNSGSKAASLSAPGAYDPNSDTLWQQYLKQYGDSKAPEWTGGDYDYTQNAAYQQYLKDWANKQAPEYAGDPYQAQRDAALEAYGQAYGGDPYQDKRDAAIEAYGEKWGGSQYQPLRDQYLQNAANMEWNYDPDTDPVWQAYQKQYRREGQRATEDTLGRVAGMTGGMPSSYAVTAASQAGNYYASQLSDKLPQLYQDAYNRYLQEYQRQLGLSDAYAGYDDREYQRWLQSQAQNLDLANAYNQYGQQDYARWLQGQQQNLDLANAYNQYGQLDYQKYLDQLSQFNTDRNFNYGAAMDAIAQGRSDYNTRYQQYLDQLGQYNTDRNFAYGAARDNQALGRQANQDEYQRYLDALSQANYEDETAYSRYRDTISDQRYDQEWAQKLREYADEQNWKATEWQQYLTEYGDKLSQTEKEWAWEQAQAAAKYGDYSGLEGMGIDTSSANPKEVAYASDGSTYKFNTQDALYFVQNAPTGATMTGSDGSTWRKDEYGGITITTKNGKVFTYSNSVVPETKNTGSGYRYTGNGGNGGNGGDGETKSDMEALRAKAPKTYADALDFLMNERGLSYNPANAMAKDYIASLDTGDQGEAPEDQTADYRNLTEALDRMSQSGRSRDEIYTEINAAVRDGLITKEQGETLKNNYYGTSDNVPNSNQTHSGGMPQSQGFNAVYQAADSYFSRGDRNKAIQAISDAYNAGKIHEYEIDIIMDRLGL